MSYKVTHLELLKHKRKNMNVFKELKRFQEDRLLNKQEFNLRVATMNILEELLEAHGVGDNKDRLIVKSIYTLMEKQIKLIIEYNNIGKLDNGVTYSEPTIEDQVDAFCDIQVFADGEIGKLGYNNEQCMSEVAKEINSRTGEIIDGKFTKFKTDEAIVKWYKADFDNCKITIDTAIPNGLNPKFMSKFTKVN